MEVMRFYNRQSIVNRINTAEDGLSNNRCHHGLFDTGLDLRASSLRTSSHSTVGGTVQASKGKTEPADIPNSDVYEPPQSAWQDYSKCAAMAPKPRR